MKIKKKNKRRFEEINIKWIVSYDSRISIMRFVMKIHYKQLFNDEWIKKWKKEKKERELFKITSKFTKKILKLHRSLKKWISSLLIQMRIQKIEFNSFLFKRRISKYEIFDCSCEQTSQEVKHVLWKCIHWRKKRRVLWKDEMKKFEWRFQLTDLKILLNNSTLTRKTVIFMTDIDLLEQYNDLAANQKI